MSTIRYMSEQVSRLYARGVDKEDSHTVLNWKEVKPHIIQKINEVMGMQLTDIKLDDSDTAPSITSGMVMTYTVPVLTRETDEYYIKLPVYPVRLQQNMGIFRVGPSGKLANAFIIIPQCYWDLLGGFEGFEGNICAVPVGNDEIIFSEDPGTDVNLSLVVSDKEKFGDTETLPITAEIESMVVTQVLELFRPELRQPKVVNVTSETRE
jgi:hypothetical protein